MAWYADLAPCREFGSEHESILTAVGWLDAAHPFPTGKVDSAVYARLAELLRDAWQPRVLMGTHECPLCLYQGERGTRNLFIAGDSTVFVCPELILHSMNAHGYRPPEAFCRAALDSPPMRTMNYFKALLGAGARSLVRGSGNGSREC